MTLIKFNFVMTGVFAIIQSNLLFTINHYKVKGFLDAEPELLKWYTVADSWKAHFDDCLADQGFYKPTPYQMYVAATICKAIAKGDKNKFVMKLGAG